MCCNNLLRVFTGLCLLLLIRYLPSWNVQRNVGLDVTSVPSYKAHRAS